MKVSTQTLSPTEKVKTNTSMDALTKKHTERAWQDIRLICPSLGKIIARMKWRVDETGKLKTVATNGRVLKVNPQYWNERTHKERVFLLAHEAGHVVQRAFGKTKLLKREQLMEKNRTNIALDLAVNGILQKDKNIHPYLTSRLFDEGEFPEKRRNKYGGYLESGLSVAVYFEEIGKQEEEEEDASGQEEEEEEKEDGNDNSEDGNDNSEDGNDSAEEGNGSSEDGNDDFEDKDFDREVQKEAYGNEMCEKLRLTIMPKKDQNTIHNWREILRDFLWRRVRDSRNFHRPSRRWDGTGVMLPGRSSRDFPKTALILDFSGSMREYLETCAETVTALIAEVSSGDVFVIGCNSQVVYRNLVRRNSKPPKSSEILRHYRGGGTHMMPAIKEAREWGAEIILCVSDMNTRSEDLRCPDVHWITSRTDPMVGTWGFEEKTPVAGKTFRILRVKTKMSSYEMDALKRQGIHIKTDEELEKQPAVSWENNKNNKKQTTRRTNRKETRL